MTAAPPVTAAHSSQDRWRVCGHEVDVEAADRGCTCTSYGPTVADVADALDRAAREARAA
ncbi:hypothetical protein ACL02T_12700 [Pseudonocardia sp. RS010]|uniref:hypothetical protein n=1 Tax=Pseudonocardia sp. RS010 TaxID=3385979 RepID=UPI0039A39F8E